MTDGHATGPVGAPAAAATVFGPRLELAVRYAAMLADAGVVRGLIGPREADRVWDRHLLNSAVIAELIGPELLVGDVGSGAGLPGLPLAIARPDLRVELIEPMERRAEFLRDVIAELELFGVCVVRARGEDANRDRYDVVTARAVAPLARLVPMALPLARVGGVLLAIKGASAAEELSAATLPVTGAGGARGELLTAGVGVVDPPTTVVSIVRLRELTPARRGSAGGRRG
ncbi:MAG: 16S rRNA (guanine(527)-N(7))-methyltransferase RsmG [Mycobacteriales bacterium]